MNKVLCFLFFLLFNLGYSQNLKIHYKLDYQPNKNDTLKKSERFILEILGNQSLYKSNDQNQLDSLFVISFDQSKKLGNAFDASELFSKKIEHTYSVFTDFSNKKIVYKDILGGQSSYSFEEKTKIEWNIQNETKEIIGFDCQKATCHFSGRNYVAWFTTEMPNSFGPYKFTGLPGLVMEIYDDRKEFKWTILSIEKNNLQKLNFLNYLEYQGYKNTQVKKNQFYQLEKQFREKPLGNYMETFPNEDLNSEFMKSLKIQEKKEIDYWKYRNNALELL